MFTAEICDENYIVPQLKYHMEGQTISQHLVEFFKKYLLQVPLQ